MPAMPQQPRRRRVILAGLAAAVALGAMPAVTGPRLSQLQSAPVQLNDEDAGGADSFVSALRRAFEQVEPLKAQVSQGRAISKFGAKADAVVKDAAAASGGADEQVERALDGALYALYLQQLAEVKQQVVKQFSNDRRPATAVKRAEAQFESRAKELVRPGSSWSYDSDLEQVGAAVKTALRSNKVLTEERARVMQAQRATADVIGKLQKNMEQLGEKLRGTGAGSPWIFWTSYHLPRTPLQISGRYTQGRANIEINMQRNKDPINAEAGFVEGIAENLLGSLGLSLNVGI